MNRVVTAALFVLAATIGFSAYAYTVYLPSLSQNTSGNSATGGLGSPGSGALNIYLADAPIHNASLKYLLINVTSITLKYSSNLTETSTTGGSSSSSSSTESSSSNSGSSPSSSSSTTTATSSSSSSTGTQNEFQNRFVFNVPPNVGTNVNLTKLQLPGQLLGTQKAPAGNVTGIILNITGAEAFWADGTHTQLRVVADGKLMFNVRFSIQSNGTTNLTLDIVPGDIHISPGNGSVLRPVVHVTAVSSGPKGTETAETTETATEGSSSTTS